MFVYAFLCDTLLFLGITVVNICVFYHFNMKTFETKTKMMQFCFPWDWNNIILLTTKNCDNQLRSSTSTFNLTRRLYSLYCVAFIQFVMLLTAFIIGDMHQNSDSSDDNGNNIAHTLYNIAIEIAIFVLFMCPLIVVLFISLIILKYTWNMKQYLTIIKRYVAYDHEMERSQNNYGNDNNSLSSVRKPVQEEKLKIDTDVTEMIEIYNKIVNGWKLEWHGENKENGSISVANGGFKTWQFVIGTLCLVIMVITWVSLKRYLTQFNQSQYMDYLSDGLQYMAFVIPGLMFIFQSCYLTMTFYQCLQMIEQQMKTDFKVHKLWCIMTAHPLVVSCFGYEISYPSSFKLLIYFAVARLVTFSIEQL